MANLQKAVVIEVTIIGDGSNVSFNLDLLKDPYFFTAQGVGVADVPENWFTTNPLKSQPSGVSGAAAGDSVSLSGSVVTYTYGVAPSVGAHAVQFFLLFPA